MPTNPEYKIVFIENGGAEILLNQPYVSDQHSNAMTTRELALPLDELELLRRRDALSVMQYEEPVTYGLQSKTTQPNRDYTTPLSQWPVAYQGTTRVIQGDYVPPTQFHATEYFGVDRLTSQTSGTTMRRALRVKPNVLAAAGGMQAFLIEKTSYFSSVMTQPPSTKVRTGRIEARRA